MGEPIYLPANAPVRWMGGERVHGVLNKINLHGSFDVVLEFEEAELENWIDSYIKEKPQEALTLLADKLQLAVKEVTRS